MPKKIKTISESVPELLTWLVAETCLEKKGIEPTKELVGYLTAKANFHFDRNKQFRKGILSKANGGNAGRDYLYMFMNLWVDGKFWEHDNGVLPNVYIPYQEEV